MSSPTISVIVPTCGRPTLARVVAQIFPQLTGGDELIVVGDGPQPAACGLVAGLGAPQARYFEAADPASCYGNCQRNYGMDRARGERLMFVDDDDEVPPDALGNVRIDAAEPVPVVFRMRYGAGILWRNREVVCGNFGGVQLVVPNQSERLGRWPVPAASPSGSDFEWASRTLAQWPPDSLRWSEAVIYHAAGHSGGAKPAAPLSIPPRIPPILHQLWIGPQPRPHKLMDAWREAYAAVGWDYRLWTEVELAGEDFRLHSLVGAIAEVNGKADLYRWELLHRYGGVFIDADSVPVETIPESFRQAEFFSCYENEAARPGLVACGAMGARPGGQILARLIDQLGAGGVGAVSGVDAWKSVGPGLLTEVLKSSDGLPATVFPARCFIPEHYTGTKASGDGPIYARQLWGSTKRIYDAIASEAPAPSETPKPCRPDSLAGKWNAVYAASEPKPYGPPGTYRLAALFLGDCAVVEDWGCGWGWFKRFLPPSVTYRGVDGSRSPHAEVHSDLVTYRPAERPGGILLRHVLDHNPDWEAVLRNALGSADAVCLVFFTPLEASDQPVSRGYDGRVGVHDWGLPRRRLEGILTELRKEWWSVVVQTGCTPYGSEEIYFVQGLDAFQEHGSADGIP